MKILSPAFKNNENIPVKYTCQGEDINPPLEFYDVPEDAQSLVLIMDDPDAGGGTFVHWILFNMPLIGRIGERSSEGIEGANSAYQEGYMGPCPPSGTHRYFFKLCALDAKLDLKKGVKKPDLEKKMQGHVLARAELIGLYKKR